MKQLKNNNSLLLIIGFAAFFAFSSCSSIDKKRQSEIEYCKQTSPNLHENMRKLWEDHIIWTRNVIMCLVDNVPGKEQAINRLLQNQVDIGNALKSYYGEKTSKQLTELLFLHITISSEVINADMLKNKTAIQETNKRWSENADDIAVLLSEMNNNWEVSHMKKMMRHHIELTRNEAQQRIAKNYDADVLAYDELHTDILLMADMFTSGIKSQFPEKFIVLNSNN